MTTQGSTPFVVEAHSSDVIATLLELNAKVEHLSDTELRLTITGVSEAHLLAMSLVLLRWALYSIARPFPEHWEQRRM